MNTNTNIEQELKEIAPILAAIPKENPYQIPMNYFDGLEGSITSAVYGMQLGTIAKENPFEVPMNYFEALPELIEKRIAGMQLEGIPKENPFEVPANYFERLDSEIIDHVIASKTQKGFHWITQLVRPKLVVSFATIAFAVFVVFKVSTLNKVDKYSFSEQEIANSNVLNDIDEGTIIETLYSETATNAIPKQGEMEKYLLDNNVDESQLTGTL